MKKEKTDYTLDTSENTVKIFKNGKLEGFGAIGIESALEAIFVIEEMTKDDWLICEDDVVYLVNRSEYLNEQ